MIGQLTIVLMLLLRISELPPVCVGIDLRNTFFVEGTHCFVVGEVTVNLRLVTRSSFDLLLTTAHRVNSEKRSYQLTECISRLF